MAKSSPAYFTTKQYALMDTTRRVVTFSAEVRGAGDKASESQTGFCSPPFWISSPFESDSVSLRNRAGMAPVAL